MNAHKHGILSLSPVAGDEETLEAWDEQLHSYFEYFHPDGGPEEDLVYGQAFERWCARAESFDR